MNGFCRRCQECFHVQAAQEPSRNVELTDAYCNAKCRKCGSAALDYGCGGWTKVDGKWTQVEADE